MFDRFLHFLRDLPGLRAEEHDPADDPRIAATALLFHVMDADGVRERAEIDQLRPLLREMFDIDGDELDRLVAAGERADREAIDLYGFTSTINRHLGPEARLELVSLMWEMVFADGDVHELEDNVIWRVAELMHVEREQRIALRRRARQA